jgi:hypothetical protein
VSKEYERLFFTAERRSGQRKSPDPRRPGQVQIWGTETRRPYHVPERMHVKSALIRHSVCRQLLMAKATSLSLAPHPLAIGMRPRPLLMDTGSIQDSRKQIWPADSRGERAGFKRSGRPRSATDHSPGDGKQTLGFETQVYHTPVWSAIPPLPEGDGFSRRQS